MPVLIFYILNVSQFDFVRPGLKKHNINSLSKLKRLGKMVNIISKFFIKIRQEILFRRVLKACLSYKADNLF